MPFEQNGPRIRLSGHCPVEDAEPLLDALRATPDAVVDLSGAVWLHTAVLQVLMAARPPLHGQAGGFVGGHGGGRVPAACLAGLAPAHSDAEAGAG
jgi:hypothetical protein